MQAQKTTRLIFAKALIRDVWAYVAAVSTVLGYVFLPRHWFWVIPGGIAALVIIGAFRTVTEVRKDCETRVTKLTSDKTNLEQENDDLKQSNADLKQKIRKLEGENVSLKRRPYNEDQRRLTEEKLRKLNAAERDLLRFLSLLGRTEQDALQANCQDHPNLFGRALDPVERDGLVTKTEERQPGRASILVHWQINPSFEATLKDLLFPCEESENPHFTF